MSYILIAIIVFCIFVVVMDFIAYKSGNTHINHWSFFSFVDDKYLHHDEKEKK